MKNWEKYQEDVAQLFKELECIDEIETSVQVSGLVIKSMSGLDLLVLVSNKHGQLNVSYGNILFQKRKFLL
jgi:hypothetical protein